MCVRCAGVWWLRAVWNMGARKRGKTPIISRVLKIIPAMYSISEDNRSNLISSFLFALSSFHFQLSTFIFLLSTFIFPLSSFHFHLCSFLFLAVSLCSIKKNPRHSDECLGNCFIRLAITTVL